jgi:hypothetical protein
MGTPVDSNVILQGATSPTPVLVPLEEEPHVITKIIGISLMCVGGMGMVGSLFSFGTIGLNSWLTTMGPEVEEALLPSSYYAATGLIAIVSGAIFLYSGYQIQKYQKKGIWIALGGILFSNIANVGITLSVEFPQGSTEIYGGVDVQLFTQATTVLGSLCGMVFCGVITILPLFFANHGLR